MKIPCPQCNGTGTLERNALEILRRRAKLTQAAIAAKLGIKQPAYNHLERARHIPWRHRAKLAEIYGVTREQLDGSAPLDPKPARPKRAPPAGAIAKSRAHREAVKKQNKARSRK